MQQLKLLFCRTLVTIYPGSDIVNLILHRSIQRKSILKFKEWSVPNAAEFEEMISLGLSMKAFELFPWTRSVFHHSTVTKPYWDSRHLHLRSPKSSSLFSGFLMTDNDEQQWWVCCTLASSITVESEVMRHQKSRYKNVYHRVWGSWAHTIFKEEPNAWLHQELQINVTWWCCWMTG